MAMNSYNLRSRNIDYHVPSNATLDRKLALATSFYVPAVPVCPLGDAETQSTTYNKNAHVTVSIDAEGMSYAYADNMGRTVRSVSGGIITDTSYSPDGRTISVITHPAGSDESSISASAYDIRGNAVASVSQPKLSGGRILVTDDSIVSTSFSWNGSR
jgi:hypothetical protein